MQISFYLFDETIKTLSEAKKHSDLNGYKEIKLLNTVHLNNDKISLYIRYLPSKPTKWVSMCKKYFDIEKIIENQGIAGVLLFEIEYKDINRVFALCFGHSQCILNTDKIDHFFGVKTALNLIDHEKIREINSRRIDTNVMQQKKQLSIHDTIEKFELEENIDWLFSATGTTKDIYHKTIAKSVGGKNSLRVSCEDELLSIQKKAKEILRVFIEEKQYKQIAPYIDALEEVKKQTLKKTLNDLLNNSVKNNNASFLTTAYPEFFDTNPVSFTIKYKYNSKNYPYITITSIQDFISSLTKDVNISKIKIIGNDEEGNPVTLAYSLLDYLIAEIEYKGNKYVYSWKKWFCIKTDYRKELISKIKKNIKDFTTTFNFPIYKKYLNDQRVLTYNEGKYNEEVFNNHSDYLLLDKKLIDYSKSQKIEIADALSKNNEYICIKRMKDSATMSHLFMQGIVSATLLRNDEKFKETVKELKTNKWKLNDIAIPNPYFVFTIPSSKNGDIIDNLFFFSQITLDKTIKEISYLGYNIGICKIECE